MSRFPSRARRLSDIAQLKSSMPFPLDDFPADRREAGELFNPYGFQVAGFVDEEKLYILLLARGC